MLIFSPAHSFRSDCVTGLSVAPAFAALPDGSSPACAPRLAVDLSTAERRVVLYSADAFSVLAQLRDAGVLSPAQAEAISGRLRDEIEISAAQGIV